MLLCKGDTAKSDRFIKFYRKVRRRLAKFSDNKINTNEEALFFIEKTHKVAYDYVRRIITNYPRLAYGYKKINVDEYYEKISKYPNHSDAIRKLIY